MREPIKYDYFHGLDGLGDVPTAPPAAASITKKPQEDIAVVGLLRASRQYEGRLTLIALGERRTRPATTKHTPAAIPHPLNVSPSRASDKLQTRPDRLMREQSPVGCWLVSY